MHGKKSVMFAVVLCVLLFASGALIANDVPEFISLDQDVYKSNRRGPVPFEHLAHWDEYGVGCADCHHVYEDGKNVWNEDDPVQIKDIAELVADAIRKND